MSDWRYITKGVLPKTDEIYLRERCEGEDAEKVFEIMFKNRKELREYFLNEIERIEKLLAEKDKQLKDAREVIEYAAQFNSCRGSAIKYLEQFKESE